MKIINQEAFWAAQKLAAYALTRKSVNVKAETVWEEAMRSLKESYGK